MSPTQLEPADPVLPPTAPVLPPTAPVLPPTAPVLRPMRGDDEPHIHRIFRETLLAGAPAPAGIGDLARYEHLCLAWYLTRGVVEVLEVEGEVRGYLLACLDEHHHRRWVRRAAAGWSARMLGEIATGRRRGAARRFVLLRLRDGWEAQLHAPSAPSTAHAHVNLDRGVRGAFWGRRLADRMDALVLEAGLPGWYAEMTVPSGRSLAAVERAGGLVVHRAPNRTLSWLMDRPVHRVTVSRDLLGMSR